MFVRRRRTPQPTTAATVPAAGLEEAAAEPAEALPPVAALDDEDRLVTEARRGNVAAFNTLIASHERAVFNVCLRLLRDVPSAEDATQDTFVKAWQGVRGFRGGLVRAWFLRIATNRCYDLLRASGRRPSTSLDAESFEIQPSWSSQQRDESPDAFALRGELAVHLERALAALPDDQRLAVILSDVQGCTYEEIVAITGAALGTVKSRISRARGRLRQALRDDPDHGELFDRYSRLHEEIVHQGDAGHPS